LAIEDIMHSPDDPEYANAGMIFGAETFLDFSRYVVTDATLEKNMSKFANQCVLYDLALGRYTINDLKRSTDILSFLGDRTSKQRLISYCDSGESVDPLRQGEKCSYCSCKDAVAKMKGLFGKEAYLYKSHDVLKHLPFTFQALTNINMENQDVIKQQLVMNSLQKEYGKGSQFANSRAYLQQRSILQTTGALAGKNLLAMRCVFEALVYASFIFILPLMALPGGFSFLKKWMGLVVWLQMWPPFYVILNYISKIKAQGDASSIFLGLSGMQKGLSLFTSAGLLNLQADIAAFSGYLSISIPFISYAILSGGVSSFIHLAGSMMGPAHTAASAAAAEQATGNYSFGNVNLDNQSAENISIGNTGMMQRNMSPSLSSGYVQENDGRFSRTYTSGQTISRQNTSSFVSGISIEEQLSKSINKTHSDAVSLSKNTQNAYSESLSSLSKNGAGYVEHLSKGENYNSSVSEGSRNEIQESARYIQNQGHNISQQTGVDERTSMGLLFKAGLGGDLKGVSLVGDVSGNTSSSYNEAWSMAKQAVKSEDFQKSFQAVSHAGTQRAFSSLNDEGKRFSQDFSSSLDEARQAQHSYQEAISSQNTASLFKSVAQDNRASLKNDFTQDCFDFATQHYGSRSRAESVLGCTGFSEEKDEVVGLYAKSIVGKKGCLENLIQDKGWLSAHQAEFESEVTSFEPYRSKVSLNAEENEMIIENISTFNGLSSGQVGEKCRMLNDLDTQKGAIVHGEIDHLQRETTVFYDGQKEEVENTQNSSFSSMFQQTKNFFLK
ncbi:hypothetical protein HON22_00485, partial [Candidatus Peregrinibacteria bacterium]|nr:hypothetical protein [Candidatus Peregrinibacteria bacterium]